MNKDILKLAIPNIISNLSVPLLGTVDTAIMGRMGDPAFIGAVALGGLVFNFIYWSFGFLRMGTTGLTAQAYGKTHQDHESVPRQEDVLDVGERVNKPKLGKGEIMHILTRAGLVAIVSSFALLLLQYPIAEIAFWIFDGSQEAESLAKEYFYIRIWAAPATMMLYALMGWFFGMQNAIYPMLLTILINAVNIIFDYVLVYNFGMKADGVALATVIAQYSGVTVGLILFFYKYGEYRRYFSLKVATEVKAFIAFFKLNGDIFLRTLLLVLSFAFFTDRSATQGDTILAANSILLQFFFWMSYGIDGFAFASESLVGKYTGAQNRFKLKKAIRYCFYWGMVLAIGYALVYWLFGEFILTIFTNQVELQSISKEYLFWMVIISIVAAPSFIWDGVYIGLMASRAMRDSMILSLIVYIITYYACKDSLGNHGLWLAMAVFMLARGVVQTLWYKKLIANIGRD